MKKRRDEAGMVTAELAFAAVFAAGFVVLLAWVVSLLLLLGACQTTAGEVARQHARGDEAAAALAADNAPPGARISVSRAGNEVVVRVDLQARPWADWLPGVPLSANAEVLVESG
jgi:hypothetical protein